MNRYTAKDKMMGWQLRANITVRGDCAAYNKAMDRLAAYEDTGLLPSEIVEMREELEKAKGDLLMVCTTGEPCAACHHCCNRGDQFPCDISNEWCGGTKWAWRGSPELKAAGRQQEASSPFDEPIPAPANRVLTLDEVLALPEGARVWVEHAKGYGKSHEYAKLTGWNGCDVALVDEDGVCWRIDTHIPETAFGRLYRVWSLPVAPTEDELKLHKWEVQT